MKTLSLIAALAATPAIACDTPFAEPTTMAVILGTHHVNATKPFDEGIGPRGLGIEWDCGSYALGLSAYKNSFGNLGVTWSYTHEALTYDVGPVSVGARANLSWYPAEETARLRDSNGFFPLVGFEMTYGPLWVHVYPAFARTSDVSFDALIVSGLKWTF